MAEEINLIDFIRVFIRQKWLILGVTIFFVFLSVIFSFFVKKSYNGYLILETGSAYIFKEGKPEFFAPENIFQVQKKINQRTYDGFLEKDIKTRSIFNVEAIVEENSQKKDNIIKINIRTNNPVEGKNYLQTMGEIIILEANKELDNNKRYFKSEIDQERAKIAGLEASKNLPELQALYNEHLSRLNDLQISLNSIKNSAIVKLSEPSYSSINLYINIFLGLLLGLFSGTFFAFIREFWQKNKKELLKK